VESGDREASAYLSLHTVHVAQQQVAWRRAANLRRGDGLGTVPAGVLSKPGYFGIRATITLPPAGDNDVAPTLSDLPQLRSQAGYAYLEAWLGSGPNAPVREFGLDYHQVGDYAGQYSLYYHAAGRYR
jgi:hypothetical protein